MRGAESGGHFPISFGTGVFIGNVDGDGRSEGFTLKDARKNLASVCLIAGGDDFTLTGPASIKVALDIGFGEWEAGRDAIDDHPDAAAVGFSPSRNTKSMAELAGHKRIRRGLVATLRGW